MDDLIVNVKIWDRLVGALIWDKNKNVASFQFEPKFLRAGLDVSPIVMPLKKSSKDTVYQFLGNRNECFLKSATIIQYTIKGRFMSR